jgi:type 1 glutamine amidotransferase
MKSSSLAAWSLGSKWFAAVVFAAGLIWPALAAPKKVLVVSVTTGFRHGSIETAEGVIEQIGKESGVFTVDFARVPPPKAPKKPTEPKDSGDAEKFKAEQEKFVAASKKYVRELTKFQQEEKEYAARQKAVLNEKMSLASLNGYDAVIFANTTGDLPLPDKEGFLDWIKSGRGFVGMHSATDTLGGFMPYVECINGNFDGHPWGGGALCTFVNHETSHPTVSMYLQSFQWKDEIYQYKHFNPESVRVLLSLDMSKTKPPMPYHVPVCWVREYGRGRLFYTNLGHNDATWLDAQYRAHILTGIRYALRLQEAPAAPNPDVQLAQHRHSIVSYAAGETKKDAAPLLAKASNAEWINSVAAAADAYRNSPTPDPKKATPEELDAAKMKKADALAALAAALDK